MNEIRKVTLLLVPAVIVVLLAIYTLGYAHGYSDATGECIDSMNEIKENWDLQTDQIIAEISNMSYVPQNTAQYNISLSRERGI